MTLAPGSRLGPYEILSPAGAGGMGEVYRARDTRLDRTVAVKILAQNLSGRPEILQRFEREARAVSTLNHANICTLHDLGIHEGTPYLVMEYVEGETLAERLTRGPLPLAEAYRVAIQIGEALDQAHRKSIVHRDLKPGNVMLTGAKGSTTVKLLDFGLAKLPEAQAAAAPGTLTSLPTVVQPLTAEGTLVGTYQYMAPEQLEGKEAGVRSDIFAFGVVLYEMITGRKAFDGVSQASLISSIMKDDPPPVSTVVPECPPALTRAIGQCLAKDPEDRWQTVRDLVRELRWISESSSVAGAAPIAVARRKRRFGIASGAAVLFAAAFAVLAAEHFLEKTPEEHTTRFLLPLPEKAHFVWSDVPLLSPDGTRIVFTAVDDHTPVLYLRSLDSLTSRRLPGTENGYFAFWSPDGRYIAFFSGEKLAKFDLTTGSTVTIGDTPQNCTGGAWNRDGVIVVGVHGVLKRVSASGGTLVPVEMDPSTAGEGGIRGWPSFLPDGDHFLFRVWGDAKVRGVYAGSLTSRRTSRILPDESNAQYCAPGYLVFHRNSNLLAVAFDAKELRVTGEPFPIGENLAVFGTIIPGAAAFSAAGSSLVYRSGGGVSNTVLQWFDRKGHAIGEGLPPADYTNPALSPDGRLLAVGKRDSVTHTRDIWIFDLTRGTSTRLTFDPADDFNPLWSPDGQRIIFTSDRKGHRDLWQKPASGVGQEELLLQSDSDKSCEDWTRDGKYVIFNQTNAGSRRAISALPLSGDRKPFPVITTPGIASEGRVSPNGKWIAYYSTESGVPEVYVQNFPSAGGKWQVSTTGGREPSWNSNGKELFYINGDQMMAVDVKTDTERFEVGTPHELFQKPFGNALRNAYLAAPDGQKILVNVSLNAVDSLPMTVVLNWQAGVKK